MSDTARISPTELEVLQVLWRLKSATLGVLHEQLADQYAYTTVQTLLDRLVEKGLVARDKSQRPAVHKPRVTRKRVMSQYLDLIVDKIATGPGPLVMQLLKDQEFSQDELKEIRHLIDAAAKKAERNAP